jgi:hypothetical protein
MKDHPSTLEGPLLNLSSFAESLSYSLNLYSDSSNSA